MPIYAYRCMSCGHAKDVLQKLSDPPLTQCPACGAQTFSKQVTAAGFQLKGSGWYATDFKGDKSAKKSDAVDGAKGDGSDGAKTDAGKTEAGKSESAKSEAPKPETSKPDAGKSKSGDAGGASSGTTGSSKAA
jgi:putative FmdB family regulatory protein